MYPVIPESDRPSDLADDCILSPDGVNPVSKNDEVPSEKTCSTTRSRYILFRVRPFRFIFRVIPTSRCRAFLQLPRGVGNTADTD